MDVKTKAIYRGSEAEMLFAARAMREELAINLPFNDIMKYDFIVDNNVALHKVQVKMTAYEETEGTYRIDCKGYERKDVDFFAFYVLPLNVWYVLPFAGLKGQTVRLSPEKVKDMYGKYKEAWELLK